MGLVLAPQCKYYSIKR